MTAHKLPPVTGIKHCPTCDTDKHVIAFSADKRSADGLYRECRECKRETDRESAKLRKMNRRQRSFYREFEE